MKVLARFLFASVLVAMLAGCASDVAYVPKLPPEAQAKLLDYLEQPDNKVFIIAIDPSGDYAYGYDYGKPTLEEAAKVAVEKVDASRETSGIIARPYVYALNDRIVYEEMIHAAYAKNDVSKEREAQREVYEEIKDDVEVDTPAEEAPAEQ